ncbi:MAG: RimK/LysX family protein [Oligoflexia bacterium]|nr:RimK/LysX family protein [Oligoflexia bacterium]
MQRFSRFTFVAILWLAAATLFAQEKESVGWQEKVRIYPANIVVHCKIDTGADYSSLNASNIEEIEKSGKQWIRFEITNRYGNKATIERELVRTALIKRHGSKPDKRPVIRLGICIGTKYMEADVNLVNRSNFETQMLIGRSFLAGNVVVDPAMTFTAEPACKGGMKG